MQTYFIFKYILIFNGLKPDKLTTLWQETDILIIILCLIRPKIVACARRSCRWQPAPAQLACATCATLPKHHCRSPLIKNSPRLFTSFLPFFKLLFTFLCVFSSPRTPLPPLYLSHWSVMRLFCDQICRSNSFLMFW